MKKTLIIILVVSCIFVIITAVVFSSFNEDKINVLIYGVDGRGTVEERERSDAIILMNINFNESRIVATSIPRDSYVKITCKNNLYDKINHAYAYGKEDCLNSTVSQLFGIKNMKNVLIDFEDVVDIVDFFGLIEITPQFSFCQSDEFFKNKYCFEKGKKILIDGKQTLAYMRNRKSLPNGDFDRIKNQRQIFKVLIDKFIKLSMLDKIKFFNYLKNNVQTNIRLDDINFKKIINVKQFQLDEYTLKGEDYINTYYYYKLDPVFLEKIKKYYI